MQMTFALSANLETILIDTLHCLLAVVEHRSLSRAATQLEMSVSSVSRKLDALEAQLGARLLVRGARQVALTDAGERFLPRARNMLAELAEGMAEVQELDREPRGVLTVTAPAGFSRLHAAPAIASFLARYPSLEVELLVGDNVVDLAEQRVDVAIRAGVAPSGELVATRLAPQHRVVSASPAYLERAGAPAAVNDIGCHRLIDKLHGADLLGWTDVLGHPARACGGQPVFACDDFEAMRLAAHEGMGIAYLPDWVVGPDIKAGQLRQLFPEWSQQPCATTGIHALRALRQPPARVTVLLDALRAAIGQPPVWALV